jgi:hypothetical protein
VRSKRDIAREILGSLVAVVIGWLAAIIVLEVLTIFDVVHDLTHFSPNLLFVGPLVFSIAIWIFSLPIWLFILLPLYIFAPLSSPVWHWPVCTFCGAIAGAFVTVLVFNLPGSNAGGEVWGSYLLGAFVGAATCFAGSMMRDRFKSQRS